MQDEKSIIETLFLQSYEKCFGKKLTSSLTESESKFFSNEIYASTGLTLGWKSLKNYSQALLSDSNGLTKASVASLDTLVRYLEEIPSTTEITRKKSESHYPYWFKFKEKNSLSSEKDLKPETKKTHRAIPWKILCFIVCIIGVIVFFFFYKKPQKENFSEDFRNVTDIDKHGWAIKNRDTSFVWKDPYGQHGLILYTLQGDNFDSSGKNYLKNVLVKKIKSTSFSVELRFSNFFPKQNWQQCGLILMEDTLTNSKCVRFSLGYNDFFGGYSKPGEVILQAISSSSNELEKPELLDQTPLFQVSAAQDTLIRKNLKHVGLRIEKANEMYRFLYVTGETELFAFTELKSKELKIQPAFIGFYSSSGGRLTEIIPVEIDKVIFTGN